MAVSHDSVNRTNVSKAQCKNDGCKIVLYQLMKHAHTSYFSLISALSISYISTILEIFSLKNYRIKT